MSLATFVPKPTANMIKKIHKFHEEQEAALLPDPKEVERKAIELQRDQKTRDTMRAILDDMMESLVVEVSLKLGGAMQQCLQYN